MEGGHWQLLAWPRNGPYLNRIKNLWAFMKRRLQQRSKRDKANLEKKTIWFHEIPNDFTENLCQSMPARVAESSKAKGGDQNQ